MGERKTRQLWIAWVLANTVGISALGALLVAGDCAGARISALAVLAAVALGGPVLGAAQYAALRRGHLQPLGWFWATIHGWVLGIIALYLVRYSSVPVSPLGATVAITLLAAIQCWSLVRLTRYVALWVPVNSLAAALASVVGALMGEFVGSVMQAGSCTSGDMRDLLSVADTVGVLTGALRGAITGAAAGFVFAAITAVTLSWLARHPASERRPRFGLRVMLPVVGTLTALIAIGAASSTVATWLQTARATFRGTVPCRYTGDANHGDLIPIYVSPDEGGEIYVPGENISSLICYQETYQRSPNHEAYRRVRAAGVHGPVEGWLREDTLQIGAIQLPSSAPTAAVTSTPAVSVREVRRLIGHTDMVWDVALSPDGRYALSWSADGTLRVWDTASGRELRRFATDAGEAVVVGDYSVRFTPDRRLALSIERDGLQWWDVAGGQPRGARVVNRLNTVLQKARDFSFFDVALGPDGKTILVPIGSELALLDTATGDELQRIKLEERAAAVAFSPKGQTVVSGGFDGTLHLWDLATGQELRAFAGHSSWIYDITFSQDGRRLVSRGNDRTLRFWDIESGQLLQRFGHENSVIMMALSPQADLIISSFSSDHSTSTICLWDAASGQELWRAPGDDIIFDAVFALDGRSILLGSGDGTLRLLSIEK